ncbi:3 exoribonuclease domain 1 containing protein [Cyclospora cayetanensis]|nr:3 exoribonuclease domain 1 containing protein [Cyclospora cayetanensis]
MVRKALDWSRCMEFRLQQLLQDAICTSQFPRCVIQVVVLLQQDDGGREACCCNATFAAVIHAGLPLRWRCWALSYASPSCFSEGGPKAAEGDVYLDPTREEEAVAAKVECVATDPTTGYLVGAFSCMRLEGSDQSLGGVPEALDATGVQGAPHAALGGLAVAAARAIDERVRLGMQQHLQLLTVAWPTLSDS